MRYIQYTFDFEAIGRSQKVKSNCNAISFINQGTAEITLQGGLIVPAGESFTLSGEGLEYDTTVYNVRFGAGTADCVVVRKLYQKG